MKLSEYLGELLPLTRENFVELQREANKDYRKQEDFNKFCERMNERGGYGALD